ncbi:MAG: redoxin domain-containing protein, partial [Deltaproteobacteria bacterium]|nr:redoxin domain-containing protein [Deltaproteobacteria bacterium]
MRGRVVIGLVVALFVVAALAIGAHEVYAAKEEGAAETLVEREAPAFQAQAYQAGEFKQVSLKGLKGKWVILFFYPQAFSYVCPTEIAKLSERYSDITGLGAEVLALSVDSAHTIKAWHESDERLKG